MRCWVRGGECGSERSICEKGVGLERMRWVDWVRACLMGEVLWLRVRGGESESERSSTCESVCVN